MNPDQYREPTDGEIYHRLQDEGRPSTDYWYVRDLMRNEFNGPPPDGFATWGEYWKSY